MTFHRAQSVQQLYETVATFDLVLVPNLPLATALNRRLDEPQFGKFATTPRQLVGTFEAIDESREVFVELIKDCDYSWKATSYAVRNVIECWQHHGDVEAILAYEEYADSVTREVVARLPDLETTSQQLSSHSIPADKPVAVVGHDQFTELERSILPAAYDTIELFTEETFEPPSFHIFESPSEIVESLLDTITAENTENVGVVLDSGSHYSSLVESALEAADIPFYGGPGFNDMAVHQAYLQLLRAGFRGSSTTVGEVRPLLAQLGIEITASDDNKRLESLDHEELAWVQSLLTEMEDHTFGEILNEFEMQTNRSLSQFSEELNSLGLSNKLITQGRVDDLDFYLQTYDIPVNRDDDGVLLADANSSGFVDRPVVFYLGVDDGWTQSAPQRPWVDAEAQMDQYLAQFQLLLQSGTEQYYLVEDTAGGEPVVPCLYLTELLETEFEQFSDLPANEYTRTISTSDSGFEQEEFDIESQTVDTVSQSSLNSFVNCPRDYFFSRLVDSPERDYFREGNLFHDFAEFYVNHPDHIDEDTVEKVVDTILEEVNPFYAASDRPLRRRTYEIGIQTIIEFLESNRPTDGEFLTPNSGFGTNFFAEHFDRDLDSPTTERWFDSEALEMKGKIDLVHDPTTLLDYKKGSKKRERKVVKQSAIDPPADTPNFQAILYLSYYRTVQPNEQLEFTFFHFLETLEDVITGEADLSETLTTVTYYPHSFDAFSRSRDAYNTLLDGYNDCVETFETLGFSAYTEIMEQLSFPKTTDKEELLSSAFAEAFETEVVAATSDDVDAQKGAKQAIRELNGVRRRAFFREDLDAFEEFIDEQVDELNHYRSGEDRFPIEGPAGEPNYRRVNNRELLLEETSDD